MSYHNYSALKLHRGSSERLPETGWHSLSYLTWGKHHVDRSLLQEILSYQNGMFHWPVEVQDPYDRHKFVKGFHLQPGALAVIHKNAAHLAVPGYADLGRFSVIWPFAVVEPGTSLGQAAEVLPQAHVESGAQVGDRAVIKKHARLRQGSIVGEEAVIGAEVVVGRSSEIGPQSRIARGVKIGENVQFTQGWIGCAAVLGSNAFYDSGVRIEHGSRISSEVFVGADVQFTAVSTVEDHVVIGAGNVIGIPGCNYPTGYVEHHTFMPAVYRQAGGEVDGGIAFQ